MFVSQSKYDMNKILTLALSLICALNCFGQVLPGKISGTINAEGGKPLDGTVVMLLRAKDSTFIKTEFSEPDGGFLFENLKEDTYLVSINHLGFEKFMSAPITVSAQNQQHKLSTVVLKSAGATNLKEVTVTANVLMVEKKIDRMVVNVDAMLSSAGGSAMDVLEKSPGIMLGSEEQIMLRGKAGVQVFIDDKPTYLSGDNLTSYLKSLPAGSLQRIEIMTNPPARYDAAGNAGIINIVTKKNRQIGFNGNVNLGFTQGQKTRTRNSFGLNYRNNKFNIYTNGSLNRLNTFEDLIINRYYKNPDLSAKSNFLQNTYSNRSLWQSNLRLGVDYYLSPKTTLGLSLNGTYNTDADHRDNTNRIENSENRLTGKVVAENKTAQVFASGTANLNLRHEFDSTGKKITVDMDYVRYSIHSDQSFQNNIYTSSGQLRNTELLLGKLPTDISIYALKSDYSQPFLWKSNVEAGVKSAYTRTDNIAEYSNMIGGVSTPDYDKSNHFIYDEVITAAYLNFNKSFGRLDLQAGLRAENTFSNGNQLGNAQKPSSSFERKYTSFFPTLYLGYKLDTLNKHSLGLSYGRRIERPFYQDLNPFLNPLDKFTFYSGNPFLRPTFMNSIELSHSYKGMVNTGFTYAESSDNIAETVEIQDTIYYSRPFNIGLSRFYTLASNAGFPVTKWWTTNLYVEGTYAEFKSQLYGQTLNSSGFWLSFQNSNTFKLQKGWTAELSGNYSTDVTYNQMVLGANGQVSVAVAKKILKGKGTLKLSGNDIFYTRVNRGIINNLNLTDANWRGLHDTRFVTLTFQYNFGKSYESRGKYKSAGSEAEQGRVKG